MGIVIVLHRCIFQFVFSPIFHNSFTMAVTIDGIFETIGEFRQYQWYLLCLMGYCLLTAGAFNGVIVAFITAEPDWKCVDGYMNNTVCRFNQSISLTSDDYNARCDMPRGAWKFVDDFTSIVTEVSLN